MQKSESKHPPLISVGSFFLAVALLVIGMLVTSSRLEAGITGFSAYWPAIAGALGALFVNMLAIVSENGSVFDYFKPSFESSNHR